MVPITRDWETAEVTEGTPMVEAEKASRAISAAATAVLATAPASRSAVRRAGRDSRSRIQRPMPAPIA